MGKVAFAMIAFISSASMVGPSFAGHDHPDWDAKKLRHFDSSSWCDLPVKISAGRNMYQTFTNKSGGAIAVTVQTNGVQRCVVALYAGEKKIGYAFQHGASGGQQCSATAIVPRGLDYYAQFDVPCTGDCNTLNGVTLTKWFELRPAGCPIGLGQAKRRHSREQ